MRTIHSAVAIALLSAAALTGSAHADEYTASIDGCRSAISERLGLGDVPTSYNLEKVRSKSQYRDLMFVVSVRDSANTIQGLKAYCRAHRNGDVTALTFDDNAALPVGVAKQ